MIRPRHILTAGLFAAIVAGGLFACKPEATEQAKKSEAWLTKFYGTHQIRGGWGFFGAEAHDKNVLVAINVPTQQSLDLKAKDADEQASIIRLFACPPSSELIWSMLDYEGDVIIQARSGGNVFADIPCRNLNPKGSVQ